MAKEGKKTMADRFNALKGEFQKVAWLDRNTVGRQITAVVIVSVIVGILIAVIDMFVKNGVDFLVKL